VQFGTVTVLNCAMQATDAARAANFDTVAVPACAISPAPWTE
jgi:hypothetical protein